MTYPFRMYLNLAGLYPMESEPVAILMSGRHSEKVPHITPLLRPFTLQLVCLMVQRYEENLRLPNIYRKKCCLNREYHSHRCRNINQQPDIADCALPYTLRRCKIFSFCPENGGITISATVRNAVRGLPVRSFSRPALVKHPFCQISLQCQ